MIVLEADSEEASNQNRSPTFALFFTCFTDTLNGTAVVMKSDLIMWAAGSENPSRNALVACRDIVALVQSPKSNDRMLDKIFLF